MFNLLMVRSLLSISRYDLMNSSLKTNVDWNRSIYLWCFTIYSSITLWLNLYWFTQWMKFSFVMKWHTPSIDWHSTVVERYLRKLMISSIPNISNLPRITIRDTPTFFFNSSKLEDCVRLAPPDIFYSMLWLLRERRDAISCNGSALFEVLRESARFALTYVALVLSIDTERVT